MSVGERGDVIGGGGADVFGSKIGHSLLKRIFAISPKLLDRDFSVKMKTIGP